MSIYANTRSDEDDQQFLMPQMRHHREIRQNELLRSRRFLVWKLWKYWQHKIRARVVRRLAGLQSTDPVEDRQWPSVKRSSRVRLFKWSWRGQLQRTRHCCKNIRPHAKQRLSSRRSSHHYASQQCVNRHVKQQIGKFWR